jgi:hypothetical protein
MALHREGVTKIPLVSKRATTLIVVISALAVSALTGASGAAGRRARSAGARVLNVHDEGKLRFVKSSGSRLLDEGHATGTFPGAVKVQFTYTGDPTVTAQFTIAGSGGRIEARGSARLSSPTTPAPSFRGRMVIIGGTGRYAHIHGSGELFGVFNRRSYGLTVQAIARLPY